MRLIEFNGLGQPNPEVDDGTIALLVQLPDVTVVRIELLPPDEYGPVLEHAVNNDDLRQLAIRAIFEHGPPELDFSRHWVVECPRDIADKARFR